MVDVEELLTTYLRDQAAVTAICGTRIFTDLPNERTYPLLALTRTGGGFLINRPQWLDSAEVGIDAYAGTRKVARTLMDTTLQALADGLVKATHAVGVVTKFTVNDQSYNPDPDSADSAGHARPRFSAVVTVLTHP